MLYRYSNDAKDQGRGRHLLLFQWLVDLEKPPPGKIYIYLDLINRVELINEIAVEVG